MSGLEVNILDKIFRRLFYYSCGFVFWLPFKGIRRYYLRLFVHSMGKDIYVGRNIDVRNPSLIDIGNDVVINIKVLLNGRHGLKLRIMDGLKLGLPVIVHKCSARGYDVYQGSPFFKSFITPEEFRKCVEEIENMYYQHSINKGIIYRTYLKAFSYSAGLDRICSIMNNK